MYSAMDDFFKFSGVFAAVECGDAKKVEQLAAPFHGCDAILKTDYRGRTALHLAVERGYEDVVEVLLRQFNGITDLSVLDCAGFSVLHLACELGHEKIVARLLGSRHLMLRRGKTENGGLTNLHLAVIRGHVKVVELLLATSPDLVNVGDNLGRSPLHFAVEFGHDEIIAMLIVLTDPNLVKAVFHKAIGWGLDKIVGQFLDLWPHLIEDDGYLLDLAATHDHHMLVMQLMARRQPRLAPVRGMYNDKTLLEFAARYGYDTIMAELLVEQPPSGKQLDSAWSLSVGHGHPRVVEQLLAYKPELIDHEKSEEGRNDLHYAAADGRAKVVELLLSRKPDLIDDIDDEGDTPLVLAWNEREYETAAILLAHKPAVIEDHYFWDSLNRIDPTYSVEIVKSICAQKPEMISSVTSHEKDTALHCVFGFRSSTVRVLLSEELMKTVWQLSPLKVLRAVNRRNETPFQIAVKCDNKFAFEMVREKLSLDEIAGAFELANKPKECPLASLLAQYGEPLLVALNKDVVSMVCE